MFIDFQRLARELPVVIVRMDQVDDYQPGTFQVTVGETLIVAFIQCLPPVGCKFMITAHGPDFMQIYEEAIEQLGEPEEAEQTGEVTVRLAWHSEKQELAETVALRTIGQRKFDGIIDMYGIREDEIVPLKHLLIVKEMVGDGLAALMTWMPLAHVCLESVRLERRFLLLEAQAEVMRAYKRFLESVALS